MENINGRLNLMDDTPNMPFILSDKIPVNSNSSFREALNGNLNNNTLSNVFFSKENIDLLQNNIRKGVYDNSNGLYIIDKQDYDTLKIIMRGIYLQHSANMETNITEQVIALNNLVLDFCVPQLVKEVKAYITYKKDVSTLAEPMSRPIFSHIDKTLQEKPFFN